MSADSSSTAAAGRSNAPSRGSDDGRGDPPADARSERTVPDLVVRRVAVLGAVVAVAVGGGVFLAADRLLSALPADAVVALEAFSRLGLYGLLALFLFQSYRLARHRSAGPVGETIPPPREAAASVPAPGDDLRRAVASVRSRGDEAYRSIDERIERWDRPPDDRRSLADRLLDAIGMEAITARRELRRSMRAVAEAGGVEVDDDSPPGRGGIGRQEHGTGSSADVLQRRTGHWSGISVLALLGLALGVFYQQPPVILASTIGIGFAVYGRIVGPPEPDVSIERTVTETSPEPEAEVDVTLTVSNDGDRTLQDLRIVDGVPAELGVSAGTPRGSAVLEPGGSRTIRYSIAARRGRHRFEPALVLARTVTGATEVVRRVRADRSPTITCLPAAKPLASKGGQFSSGRRAGGRRTTAQAGSGVEFHSLREYHAGDPASRIDWNRYARSRELSTISYHEARPATAIVAVDARAAAYRQPVGSVGVHAVDRSVDGAATAFASLLADGHAVGLASIGPEPLWLRPARGEGHLTRGRRLLGTAEAVGVSPPESTGYDLSVLRLAPLDAELLLFSPLCDDDAVAVARTLQARGASLTVVSPDPTTVDGPERAIARLERRERIDTLRSAGVRIVEWEWDEPFERVWGGR